METVAGVDRGRLRVVAQWPQVEASPVRRERLAGRRPLGCVVYRRVSTPSCPQSRPLDVVVGQACVPIPR